MTAPGTGNAAPERPQTIVLAEPELERLRAAGRWARSLARTGMVAFSMVLVLLLDVGVRNGQSLTRAARAQQTPMLASGALFVLAGIVAIALLWSYAGNVAAFFVRGEPALTRSFRRLRQFFMLWTCYAAIGAFLEFIAAWTRF
jgi:hypothetical protein